MLPVEREMNFSGIPNKTVWGRLLRVPLRWIPPQICFPIVQGRLRGKRWIVGSGDHGCWLGSYEWQKQRLFEKMVRPGAIVFDVGAHAGFYTLLASVLAGPAGQVISFEPLASNVERIKRHLSLNGIRNVTIVEAAVSDRDGVARFEAGPSTAMGHFSRDGALQVRTVALDELSSSGAIPAPDHIKIDAEGAELLVLQGARRLLAAFRPIVYLSTDTGDLHQQCCRFLGSLQYDLQPIDAATLDASYEILACPR